MADVNLNQMNAANGVHDVRSFLSGVVEGFYGRPWTPEQRKDLFCKQEKWGMNCYLYAPKDDYKHRAYWRELYTVEEAEHLQALISEASRHNIVFYYAISPGLDIAYSSQKELGSLKRKLEQVQQLGCGAFALLFDDIDPEMSGADKEVYQSFAHAQVSVANEVYTHLNQPKFMLCPTQYCSTRAVPSVQTSEYLNTLGAKLAPEIDIMWTGPKVISKSLTVEHIREVSAVLRRPPVIWDNLHANDYDQARLFLGPFCGRSPCLIPLLRGVVTNPNCEYGPNFIAIHTLAQWARSATEENGCPDTMDLKDDAVSADIRLETEGDDLSASYCPSGLPPTTYHPRRALRLALQDWLPEFCKSVLATGPIQQPQIPLPIPIVPSVNTCMSLTSTTTVPTILPTIVNNINQVAEVILDSSLIPTSTLVMNSLVSETKIDTLLPEQLPVVASNSSHLSQDATSNTSSAEPMDCNHSPAAPTATNPLGESSNQEADNSAGDPMVVEQTKPDSNPAAQFSNSNSPQAADVDSPNSLGNSLDDEPVLDADKQLTLEDLLLLADLFYLPFEHGRKGISIMTEFNWLKSNSQLVIEHNRNHPDGTRKPEVQEWYDKAAKFGEVAQTVKKLGERLFHVRNRSLLYELYPYVWDMCGVVSLLNSYVKWLALGQVSTLVSNFVHGNYTWFSKGWREAFMSGDQEPWVFRGGLTAELQRLIPVDASNDLFLYKPPETQLNRCFVIRPYLDTDREALYGLVLQTADDGRDATALYGSQPNLAGDVLVGSFLRAELSERVLMLVEDDSGTVVGYCCAASNARTHCNLQAEHIASVRDGYPKVVREEGTMLTACEQLLASLWDEPAPFPNPSPISPPTPPTAMSQGATPPPTSAVVPSTESLVTLTTSSTPPETQSTVGSDGATASPQPINISASTAAVDTEVTTNGTSVPPSTVAATDNLLVSPMVPAVAPISVPLVTGVLPTPAALPGPATVGDMLRYYPATLRLALLPTVLDESIVKRLLTCILASLRAKGGCGSHVKISTSEKNCFQVYVKLGFSQIGNVGDTVYMARSF